MIAYKDFQKLDIKIGTVLSIEKVPNADKLLKLMLDVGEEKPRQILAGILQFYPDFEKLIGKQLPVLVNLKPRTMKGLESQGMILAADVNGVAVLLHPEKAVPAGSGVK